LTKNDIENRDLNAKHAGRPDQAPVANYSLGRNRLTELLNEMLREVE
jgi:hypothetical protein